MTPLKPEQADADEPDELTKAKLQQKRDPAGLLNYQRNMLRDVGYADEQLGAAMGLPTGGPLKKRLRESISTFWWRQNTSDWLEQKTRRLAEPWEAEQRSRAASVEARRRALEKEERTQKQRAEAATRDRERWRQAFLPELRARLDEYQVNRLLSDTRQSLRTFRRDMASSIHEYLTGNAESYHYCKLITSAHSRFVPAHWENAGDHLEDDYPVNNYVQYDVSAVIVGIVFDSSDREDSYLYIATGAGSSEQRFGMPKNLPKLHDWVETAMAGQMESGFIGVERKRFEAADRQGARERMKDVLAQFVHEEMQVRRTWF